MMRVAVIDDEPLARSGIITRLARCPDIEVVAEYCDGASALTGIAVTVPDLIFIDIQMPGMNGLQVLDALAPHTRPMAILLTAYDHFALQAFALNVLDYLLKPIDDERFCESLERARLAWPYRRADPATATQLAPAGVAEPAHYVETFTVRSGSRIVFVSIADVVWIEADGDYAALHAGGKQHLVRESLQRLMQRLDPRQFVRVHRSTIVRIDQVAELRSLTNRDALLRLNDGTPLRASRTYIAPLIEALQRFRGCLIS
ncbi:MAG: LytTR family DNA-binding domain-containing protein [Sideroxyarcus sp.]|nr:LytTR family DNA-binding domain-containing protein [Sideroxyarcus sp.]